MKYKIGDKVRIVSGGKESWGHPISNFTSITNPIDKNVFTIISTWYQTVDPANNYNWYELEGYGNWVTEGGLELVKEGLSLKNLVKGECYAYVYDSPYKEVVIGVCARSGSGEVGRNIRTNSNSYTKTNSCFNATSVRLPSDKERNWLNACLNVDKFVPMTTSCVNLIKDSYYKFSYSSGTMARVRCAASGTYHTSYAIIQPKNGVGSYKRDKLFSPPTDITPATDGDIRWLEKCHNQCRFIPFYDIANKVSPKTYDPITFEETGTIKEGIEEVITKAGECYTFLYANGITSVGMCIESGTRKVKPYVTGQNYIKAYNICGGAESVRLSTQQEKEHFNACVNAGKFVEMPSNLPLPKVVKSSWWEDEAEDDDGFPKRVVGALGSTIKYPSSLTLKLDPSSLTLKLGVKPTFNEQEYNNNPFNQPLVITIKNKKKKK